ncbi:hypothetical protein RCL1_008529 [Eukaryota sp. TZLM3-RCL]
MLLSVRVLPICASLIGFTGILASLCLSLLTNSVDWNAKHTYYISEFTGLFPQSVPFMFGVFISSMLFFSTSKFLIARLLSHSFKRTSSFLSIFMYFSVVSAFLMASISTYDSDYHTLFTWFSLAHLF